MSHLNDNYYNGSSDLRPEMLMNAASDTGPGVTKLSDIEIGIMADLGYKMVGLSNATMVSASPDRRSAVHRPHACPPPQDGQKRLRSVTARAVDRKEHCGVGWRVIPPRRPSTLVILHSDSGRSVPLPAEKLYCTL